MKLQAVKRKISFNVKFFFKKNQMQICNFDKCEYFKGIVGSKQIDGLIAQSVEHRPFKAGVPGSSPGQPTIFCKE